ncbi:MAG: hypothetical protein NC337_14535 [Roseburia sp.]|nr:hypothetical protein [Roseburia sp.]
MMLGFILWEAVGAAIIAMGVYTLCARTARPFGFWANVEMFAVTDVRAYNKALGKLWLVFGVVFLLLGLPLLAGQNSGWVLITIPGAMAEAIAAMAVYTIKIEKKYKKSENMR